MGVGSSRPTLPKGHKDKDLASRFVARCYWLAEWFYFGLNNIALLKFFIEAGAAAAIVATVIGVLGEIQQRETDRGVRVATLFAQIAQVHALPEEKGLPALRASVEALAREGVPMININLSKANLGLMNLRGAKFIEANLSGTILFRTDLRRADLRRADLSGAQLSGADLRWADLRKAHLRRADLRWAKLIEADLSGANLAFADLSGADLSEAHIAAADLRRADLSGARLFEADLHRAMLAGTNLSGADLRRTMGLSQRQLAISCAAPGKPPLLPLSLVWKKNSCQRLRPTGGED